MEHKDLCEHRKPGDEARTCMCRQKYVHYNVHCILQTEILAKVFNTCSNVEQQLVDKEPFGSGVDVAAKPSQLVSCTYVAACTVICMSTHFTALECNSLFVREKCV